MARTDAHAVEGQQAALDRAAAYVDAGADMIFAEALNTLDEYRDFTAAVGVPVLANITEFGKTPLFTTEELGEAGVRLTQKSVIDSMQTRSELYEVLGYHDYERKLDELFIGEQDD
jgi:methylisocitrate lyase